MINFVITLDTIVLSFEHAIALPFGFILTPFCKTITLLGEKCWPILLIGFIFLFQKNTRKYGIAMIGAVAIAFIIIDILLKNNVARLRPYEANILFKEYFDFVKAKVDSGYSFPSGHVGGFSAGLTAFIMMLPAGNRKKYVILSIVIILLMSFARTYLMHHYPSDCVVGIIVGIFSALLSFVITKVIYIICRKNKEKKIFNFLLNWSLIEKNR